jgi:hypothetical protein
MAKIARDFSVRQASFRIGRKTTGKRLILEVAAFG